METSSSQTRRHPLPLRILFEGQSSRLTTILHTTMAILLVVRIKDLRSFFLVPAETDGWTRKLVFYLACMFTAAFAGALSVGALSLNLRPLTKENWRARTCRSIFALFLIDTLVLDTVDFAIRLLQGDAKDVVSIPATVFMSAIAIVFTIWFNVMYVRMFGCCVCCCCCCCEKSIAGIFENAEHFTQDRQTMPKGEITSASTNLTKEDQIDHETSSGPEFLESCRRTPFESLSDRLGRNASLAEESRVVKRSLSAPVKDSLNTDQIEASVDAEHPVSSAPLETVLQKPKKEIVKGGVSVEPEKLAVVLETEASSSSHGEKSSSEKSSILSTAPQIHPPLSTAHRWDTVKLVELGSEKLRGRQSHSKHPSSHTCEIIVEESEKVTEAPQPSRRGSGTFSVAGIVKKFTYEEEDALWAFDFSQWSIQNLWNLVCEEPGHFHYSSWIKSAFFTSVIILVYTYIRTLAVFSHLSGLYKENRDRFNSNTGDLDVFLRGAGWENGIDDVEETTVVKLYFIVDAIALDLKHVCWVGYSLGLLVGLYSLVAVLAQHKRISLAVSDGLNTFRQEAASRNEEAESPWTSFQKKYPILGAVRFLAVLSSTAVVQLHIVGFTISFLTGVIVNANELSVLMDIIGFYLLAYAVLFVANILLMQFLRSVLITPDDAHIIYPRWFNFTMVALSMVHLVVGLLYAVWRFFLLASSTILSLTRLDISPFYVGKQLDAGHNAFMAMLVLTVLIQEDHECFTAQLQQTVTGSEVKMETANESDK